MTSEETYQQFLYQKGIIMKNHNLFICSDENNLAIAALAARKYALLGYCPLMPQMAWNYLDCNSGNERKIAEKHALKHLNGSSFIAVNIAKITPLMQEHINIARRAGLTFLYYELEI